MILCLYVCVTKSSMVSLACNLYLNFNRGLKEPITLNHIVNKGCNMFHFSVLVLGQSTFRLKLEDIDIQARCSICKLFRWEVKHGARSSSSIDIMVNGKVNVFIFCRIPNFRSGAALFEVETGWQLAECSSRFDNCVSEMWKASSSVLVKVESAVVGRHLQLILSFAS